MENRNLIKYKKQPGFALLITIMVVSVVVAVTLAIVELSMKQLELSVNSVDSELAFQAANAGLECARFWRREESDKFESGGSIPFDCFTQTKNVTAVVPTITKSGGLGDVYLYKAELSWGVAPYEKCSQMNIMTMVVPATSTPGVTTGSGTGNNSLKKVFAGYPTDSKTCEPGGQCTVISVTGYSDSCLNKTNADTQRREILLEF